MASRPPRRCPAGTAAKAGVDLREQRHAVAHAALHRDRADRRAAPGRFRRRLDDARVVDRDALADFAAAHLEPLPWHDSEQLAGRIADEVAGDFFAGDEFLNDRVGDVLGEEFQFVGIVDLESVLRRAANARANKKRERKPAPPMSSGNQLRGAAKPMRWKK